MNNQSVIVSAVIPTRNRGDLVCRAARSVLAQTVAEIECIVVIDGPDEGTEQALQQIEDSRLRVIALEDNVGGCEARNVGVRAAQGEWVALLDDDDEWLPTKLAVQLAAASVSPTPPAMVVSRYLDRGGEGDDLLRPQKFPRVGQPISEFLWCEVSYLGGIVGFPQTSTWLVRREFLEEVPFSRGLKVLQDLDWLLRAYPHRRMRVTFVEEPLTIFHNELTRGRVTKRIDWQYCRDWAMANRNLFTRKAFGFFLVIYCVNPAARQGASWSEMTPLLGDVQRYGQYDVKLLGLSFLYTCVYPLLSKGLSRRRQISLLYRVLSVWRRPPEDAKLAHLN